MGYATGQVERYTFPVHDFGAGALSNQGIIGPKGKRGRILDFGVAAISEAFTDTTTSAKLMLGTNADADAYGLLDLGTTAIGDDCRASFVKGAIIDADLPADTQIELTGTAPTGGTPAGIGAPYVVINWF
jgi:hypothetical protein